MFQAIAKFTKGDWGILPEEDKESNNKAKTNGNPILGLYKAGYFDVVVVLPKQRNRLEVMMKHELSKERIHTPVLYDSRGNRMSN